MKKTKAGAVLPPVTEKRTVRHAYTTDEMTELHERFHQSFTNKAAVEAEFDNVKASYKAKVTEAEAKMATIAAQLQAKCEMREKECFVIFRYDVGKKEFYVIPAGQDEDHRQAFIDAIVAGEGSIQPDITEDMTNEDRQQDLVRGDKAFESLSELVIWDVEQDRGAIVVGKQRGKWFAAVRARVGGHALEERLDPEGRAFKVRQDAITKAGERTTDWLESTLGKDAARGFAEPIQKVVEGEKEKVE